LAQCESRSTALGSTTTINEYLRGKKEGKRKEGRKEGKKEGRKGGRKGGRKREGRKEGRVPVPYLQFL
jgi:hypothetical protein